MSAIWGIINLENIELDYSLGIQMEQAMKQYKLDRSHTMKYENAVFGCGIQYITSEAVNEKLPYYDANHKNIYTADCILDNREELIRKLSINDATIPDGYLLYLAYLEWGERFTESVLGSFSMVVYSLEENTCYLFTDHTGSRSLYYSLVHNTIYFATTFAALLAVLPKEDRKFNEKWMVACELLPTPIMEFYPGVTPFEKINQVVAGHNITIRVHGSHAIVDSKCYWNISKMRKVKLKTQEEYRELFLKTFTECVESTLRSNKNTGITLSSGLDSTSVACIAAKLLDQEKKKLYSYTSIPIAEYKEKVNPYFITDESEGVRSICRAYKNIEAEFVRCEGKNAHSELQRIVKYLEFPHKSRQNMVWLDEIYERAAMNDCKIVLKGQYGNVTISKGNIYSRVYDELKHFRIRTAYHEMNLFCKNNHYSRKKALKVFVRELVKELWNSTNRFEDTIVRKDLLNKHKIIRHINRHCKTGGSSFIDLRSKRHELSNYRMSFTQLGALDTRFGLYHGIMIRDPLKDKRMIELCASLPIKCFVQEGVERAAVRRYMRGIVPDSILDIVNRRGLQGADYITRIRMDWERIRDGMLDELEEPKLLDYIESEELKRIRDDIERSKLIVSEDNLIKALMLSSFSTFLHCFGG